MVVYTQRFTAMWSLNASKYIGFPDAVSPGSAVPRPGEIQRAPSVLSNQLRKSLVTHRFFLETLGLEPRVSFEPSLQPQWNSPLRAENQCSGF